MSGVITVEELADGPKVVTVDGRKLLVCEIDGEIHAYRNVCPHQYGPAVEGRLDADRMTVTCPWHGFEFDLESGEDPLYGKALPERRVTVKDGEVHVR